MKDLFQKSWFTHLLMVAVVLLILIPSAAYLLRDYVSPTSLTTLGKRAFG